MLRLCLLLLLTVPVLAQDRAALLRSYLDQWNGYPLTAAVFQRYVEVQADADWWSFLMANPTRKSAQFIELGDSLAKVARNVGLGDAFTAPEGPPQQEMLDSWKGKLAIRVAFPPGAGLSQDQKNEVMDNLALLCSPMGDTNSNLPRGGKFLLNVSFNAKAKAATGQVSKDGTTFDLVFPVYERAYTSQLENVFKKGMK